MSSSFPLYYSVEKYAEGHNLDVEKIYRIAPEIGRKGIREIAEETGYGKSTVQRYKKKLEELDDTTYYFIMSQVFQARYNKETFSEE